MRVGSKPCAREWWMPNRRTAGCRNARPTAAREFHHNTARNLRSGAATRGVLLGREMLADVLWGSRGGGSRALGDTLFHLDGDHGLIVKGTLARGMLFHCLKQRGHHAVRRLLRATGDHPLHPSAAKHLAGAVACIENAVAEEHQHVARLG